MHKEALGDFNQALATRGRTGGLGSGLHREGMAPGKVKGGAAGARGALWRSPDLRLTLSVHLVPALALALPNPGTKNSGAGPSLLTGATGILPPAAPLEYPAPTEAPLTSPGDLSQSCSELPWTTRPVQTHRCWKLSPPLAARLPCT